MHVVAPPPIGLVRRARAADTAAVASLYAALVANPALDVQPAQLAALAADSRCALFVFEQAGAVLGTVLVALCADAMFGVRPFAVAENIVVAEAARGRGVGAALLREVERFCAAADCSKIMLLSATRRADAHAFFERRGYDGGAKRGFVKYRAAFDAGASR